jgi:hypothetical protein
MFRRRFRQWWREEGLITVIVFGVCVPLMLLAVGNSGYRDHVGNTFDPNRSFR